MRSRTTDSYTKYALNMKDYERLLLACRTQEMECLFMLACEMGLRREDVVNLEVANVDLQNRKLIFREEKKNRNRVLPLPEVVASALRKYLSTGIHKDKWLFPSKHKDSKSGHLSGMQAWRLLQQGCRDASITPPVNRKDRPFHSLRGTCYKLKRYRDGWTVEQCAAWLGDSVQVAAVHYGAISDGDLAALVHGKG